MNIWYENHCGLYVASIFPGPPGANHFILLSYTALLTSSVFVIIEKFGLSLLKDDPIHITRGTPVFRCNQFLSLHSLPLMVAVVTNS